MTTKMGSSLHDSIHFFVWRFNYDGETIDFILDTWILHYKNETQHVK